MKGYVMIWTPKDINEFIKTVILLSEERKGFDDRISYDEALEFAKA